MLLLPYRCQCASASGANGLVTSQLEAELASAGEARNRIRRACVLAGIASIVLAGWSAHTAEPARPLGAPRAQAADVEFVIHISIDGLRADLLQALLANDSAGLYGDYQRFVDEGATTFNARTDFAYTNTIPNHTTMLTGRPVSIPAGQPITTHHGYTNNSDPGPTDTLHNRGNPNLAYVASVFDVVHDNGLTTGLYASKSKFVIYEQSYNAANGAPDVTAADDGTAKIDTYINMSTGTPSNASNLHAAFIQDLTTNPRHYSFVHYRDPDTAGHAAGWGSASWNDAVRNVGGYLGDVFGAVETTPALQGRTVIIVTTDHGGSGTDHSQATVLAHYRIPLFVWGASIRAGADLYALNPGARSDPGTGKPDYNASPPPIRNGDTGNLALQLLGLGIVPGSTINAVQDLNAGQGTVAVRAHSMGGMKSQYR